MTLSTAPCCVVVTSDGLRWSARFPDGADAETGESPATALRRLLAVHQFPETCRIECADGNPVECSLTFHVWPEIA